MVCLLPKVLLPHVSNFVYLPVRDNDEAQVTGNFYGTLIDQGNYSPRLQSESRRDRRQNYTIYGSLDHESPEWHGMAVASHLR